MRARRGVLTDGVCVAMATLVVALGAGACEADPQHQWAHAAEDWAAAYDASWGIGISNAGRFYAAGVEVDQRMLAGYAGIGPAGFIQSTRDNAQELPTWLGGRDATDTFEVTRNEPVYVSVDGLVDPVTLHAAGYHIPTATYQHMSAQGIDVEIFAGSAQAGAGYGGMNRPADEIVGRYLSAWQGSDPEGVLALYSPGARLSDSLLAVQVEGAAAIGALAMRDAATGGLPAASLHIAGNTEDIWTDTPDYYVNGPADRLSIDRLVLLMDVPDENGCTRAVASVLWLDEAGLITREERLHRVDTLRECAGDAPLPSGWWDRVRLPDAPVVRRTGTLAGPDGVEVTLWNGEGLAALGTWALQRFADAGLAPPTPISITFLPEVDGDPWTTYGFLTGSDAPDLGVPVTRERACTTPDCATWSPQAKAAMLHELAHMWIPLTSYSGQPSQRMARTQANDYLASHDLTWHDPALPWGQRGTERAAETITWGLMDQPYTVDARLGVLTCAELAEDFTMLTYSTPDPRSCAETAGGAEVSP